MLTRVGVPVESEAEPSAPDPQAATLVCFSHLRWNFVFQRPQHLMSRFARDMTVQDRLFPNCSTRSHSRAS